MTPPAPSRPGLAQARGCTTVRTVALLLPATGSAVVEVIVGVFVSVVGVEGAVTVMVTVIVLPLAIAPNVHVTVAAPAHEPWVVDDETKVVPAGIVSGSVPSVVFSSTGSGISLR